MRSALSAVLLVETLHLDADGLVGHLPGVVHLAGQLVLHRGQVHCPRGDHQLPWLWIVLHGSEVATCYEKH